jgi:3'-5' exoribonuclease
MEKIAKKKLIDEYKEGDFVDDIFVVKIKKSVSSYEKGYYFSLILTDSSGKSIDYRYWGAADESKVKQLYDSIKEDSVVHIKGKFSSYKGKSQITSNEQDLIELIEKGQYNEEDFIKKSLKNIEELYVKLEKYMDNVNDENLKSLLKNIFNEEIREKFKKHPAAISIHHNWVGGLLEHTLEVVRYCELSKEMFPELNKDLLITGALLHDIGKLEEMEMTTRIKGTNKGMFTGHLVLGSILISNKMDEIGIDNTTKEKILHMIVSHHGKKENGSPKESMFPESVVLYFADEMSSKTAEMIGFIKDNKDETEDDFMYHYKKGFNIFLR